MWDNLLQSGLSSLRFFPSWLEKFRALVAFLRKQAVQVKFGEHLRSKGLHVLALILEGTALPNFADWRWGALHQCMKILGRFFESRRQHFDAAVFKNAQEGTRMDKVAAAFLDDAW